MDFFDSILLLGGVSLFLFGMSVMSTGLEKSAGGRMQMILQSATSNRFKAFLLGVAVTCLIQSSSAVTVMLVGLVNSGIMQLGQTIGVIMGTNIGTTITAWIISLTGLTGSSFIIKILKPDNFAQIFAVIGIGFMMFSKKEKKQSAGEVFLGFTVLMAGIAIMRDAVSGLEQNEAFRNLMVAFSNPLLGLLFGTFITCVIQSSSAAVGILQAISMAVGVSYGTAIPVIMGMKIGTCITATLSSLGTNKSARRVVVVHVSFNVIGACMVLTSVYGTNAIYPLPILQEIVTPASIAIMHTLFAAATTIILFPFAKQLEKLALFVIKEQAGEITRHEVLDERLLSSPAIAIAHSHNLLVKMSHTARNAVLLAMGLIEDYDDKAAYLVHEYEDVLDKNEDTLNRYLVKLSAQGLHDGDSWKVSEYLHAIGDLERIGDHAVNILESAQELNEKKLEFSAEAKKDLEVAHAAIREILNLTISAFEENDSELAKQVEPLEEVIDGLIEQMRNRHIIRLQRGECSIVPGFIWSDLLIDYERVSDHCSNMAVCLLQTNNIAKGRHVYLAETRTPENIEFTEMHAAYQTKYFLANQES
ncbi:MAG: Na/Pi cotransporter family protein [Oscillospiraceae bacterium]|nr:Na/Pi cotransporter family protein [Oscillospiraceae bacterium]